MLSFFWETLIRKYLKLLARVPKDPRGKLAPKWQRREDISSVNNSDELDGSEFPSWPASYEIWGTLFNLLAP